MKPAGEPSASATSAAPEVIARPRDAKTEAGAIAFSEFVVRTIVATTGGADIDDFLSLSTSSCAGCITLAKQVGEDPDEVQKFESPPKVTSASVIKTEGNDFVTRQTVSMSAGRKVSTDDESVISAIEPNTYSFVIRSTWTSDRWVIADYAVEDES